MIAAKHSFHPTFPLRGATLTNWLSRPTINISIRTLLAGSDLLMCQPVPWRHLFQSTLPLRGATFWSVSRNTTYILFQSTLPLRGATAAPAESRKHLRYFNPRSPCGERLNRVIQRFRSRLISIHAPLAGSDPTADLFATKLTNFNPRSPCGERPSNTTRKNDFTSISIHAPLAGSDLSTDGSGICTS